MVHSPRCERAQLLRSLTRRTTDVANAFDGELTAADVAWLRQKVKPNPRHPQFIMTVHGLGYKFAGQQTRCTQG